MNIDRHVVNTVIFEWFHRKIDRKTKLEIFQKKVRFCVICLFDLKYILTYISGTKQPINYCYTSFESSFHKVQDKG